MQDAVYFALAGLSSLVGFSFPILSIDRIRNRIYFLKSNLCPPPRYLIFFPRVFLTIFFFSPTNPMILNPKVDT